MLTNNVGRARCLTADRRGEGSLLANVGTAVATHREAHCSPTRGEGELWCVVASWGELALALFVVLR